ncbi:uncharacterized protein [Euphorbia lathyris]|uniref:uncharacterized protein n=1 Tax=Euphorbia lathyris TaxID=212925 RepID=UPI0033141C16
MTSFLLLLFLCLTIFSSNIIPLSDANSHRKKPPSAVVVGSVYCDTCFHQDFSKNSHFISGASVEVECNDETSKPSFHQQVKTDENGEFRVHLPFSVAKHVKRIKKCSVKLLTSSEPYCSVASTAKSSLLRLKSRKEGIHVFSAGFFSFKPEKQPILCNEKPQKSSLKPNQKSSLIDDRFPPFPPPLQDPVENNFFLPPLPTLPPLPQLPPLPPLPGLPFFPPATGLPLTPPVQGLPPLPPFPGKKAEIPHTQELDKKVAQPNTFPMPPLFPPNPFQPPPIFPPILQPPPLFPPILQPPPLFPPLLPPNPLQPPPSPLIPLPPIPFLTPPPPPPLIPSFPPLPPFGPLPPFPPFPFPPSPPRVPGPPPVSTSP